MRKLILLIFVCFSLYLLKGQDKPEETNYKPRKNAYFVEPLGGGSGYLGTFNYARVLWAWKFGFIDAKVGLGFINVSHGLSVNLGARGHYLQLGYGGAIGSFYNSPIFSRYYASNRYYTPFPNIGYKFQHHKRKLYFGLYYMPTRLYVSTWPPSNHTGYEWFHSFGLGIGQTK